MPHITKPPPPNTALGILAIIVMLLCVSILMQSCNVVKKNTQNTVQQTDSARVVKSEKINIFSIDTSSQKSTETKDLSVDETNIAIQFENDHTDTVFNPPIIITKKTGEIKIDVGNRKVKTLLQHTKTTALQNNKIAENKTAIVTDSSKENINDSTHLIKENKVVTTQKSSYRFNWYWFLLLIPIGLYSYYRFKK